ncbi:MAG: ATP-binding protein [Clostridia bacterium]|nr:ATP-binding protein [Clostridia bacterium]
MLKLIVGVKGTGKTKTLIELVNKAAAESKGSVICIERGSKLNYDVTHKARLIDSSSYKIEDGQALYGFIAGITASDHDITDLFVDSALKICGDDMQGFELFVKELDKLVASAGYNCVMTVSAAPEDCAGLRDYL